MIKKNIFFEHDITKRDYLQWMGCSLPGARGRTVTSRAAEGYNGEIGLVMDRFMAELTVRVPSMIPKSAIP